MDETIETLTIGVRADTAGFAADAATMQSSLQNALGTGASQAGSLIETSLSKAIASGKLGFDDLAKTALAALDQIAAQAVTSGLSSLLGVASGGSGGLLSAGTGLLGSLLGLPGRATGGPVSPGRPYMVGEQGPELFVPASAGSVAPSASSPARSVNVAISVAAPVGTEPQALARSSRQVARAVSRALQQADR